MPRSSRLPLLGALACFAGLAVTGVLALLLPAGRSSDAATLEGFRELDRPWLTAQLDQVAHLADPLPYAVIGFSLAGIALLRRRPRVAVAIALLLVATGWTTRTLKPLLAHPRIDDAAGAWNIADASWPSGHATASMTLALCAVLAVPARARPTAAVVGAAFAVSVSYSLLALGWHFPSDVFGGFFVATAWTLLAVAGLVALERRHPSGVRREPGPRRIDALAPLALAAGVVVGVGVAALLSRPVGITRFAVDHSTFVVGAGAIAAMALGLAFALARGVTPGDGTDGRRLPG